MILSDRKLKIFFYGMLAFILGAFILTAFLTGCSSQVKKQDSAMVTTIKNEAKVLREISKINCLDAVQKTAIKNSADELDACAVSLTAKDAEIFRLNEKVEHLSKDAGAGSMIKMLLLFFTGAGIVYILHRIKVIP